MPEHQCRVWGGRVLCTILACIGFIHSAYAESLFYQDDMVSLSWPEKIPTSDCDPFLKSHSVKNGCVQLGDDGSLGAVFMTKSPGYSLGTQELLQKHLDESEEALFNIPGIHVMQTRVLKTEPLMGLMEIERRDGTMSMIESLRGNAIRQTSLLIPTGDMLVQVFIYLPMNGQNAMTLYSTLMEEMVPSIRVQVPPVSPPSKETIQSHGTLELLPRALWLGGILAAVIVLISIIMAQIRSARRKQQDRLMQAQIDSNADFNCDISDNNLKNEQ